MMMMSGNRDAEVEMLKSQLQVARSEINNLRWVFEEGSFVGFFNTSDRYEWCNCFLDFVL